MADSKEASYLPGMSQQIQLFTSADGQAQLQVALEHDTLWLSQAQMGELFDTTPENVLMHLKNIFNDGELAEQATTKDFLVVRQEGARQVRRRIKHYSLDAIISVGYRVSSRRATQFRQWATRVLQAHLVEGYTLNQRRLAERGIEFEQAVSLLSRTLANQQLVNDQGRAVLQVIGDYARSWSLLQGYDEQSLQEQNTRQADMRALELDDVVAAIAQLKATLMAKGEATELFGQLRGDGLASAIATIEQGFGDEWFYPNVASRAAHLLYFVIKNHPLADGNKRSGSFLFLWYLQLNQHLLARPVEQLINDNTLVALALLVAESLPEQKELMVRLVEHFVLLRPL
ncbi:virulence protein RhuM/Fic/DOC family protein [Pseudomonas luteola]|uniref:virulence protein RhuM/Fic/DOC family protein n=1 Tax=Pseudomonas luteola TaxID=47886 RepID=UPI000910F24E|nr:virulence protein RhuM/Fic/DOC family protein [Pseudomonas zeshuii]SHJ40921.1 Fic/DOC family protein [Pseudomonas zeshuii]